MKKLSLISLLLLLSACGYHLKSVVELDDAYNKTYINHAISAPLYRPLAVALSNQGLNLVEDASEATARISIIRDSLDKQVQSIGINNRVQEYRLDYELTFSVDLLGEVAVPEQTLTLSRDYAFDISQITGAQSEERILREQMYKDMAQMIVRSISSHSAAE